MFRSQGIIFFFLLAVLLSVGCAGPEQIAGGEDVPATVEQPALPEAPTTTPASTDNPTSTPVSTDSPTSTPEPTVETAPLLPACHFSPFGIGGDVPVYETPDVGSPVLGTTRMGERHPVTGRDGQWSTEGANQSGQYVQIQLEEGLSGWVQDYRGALEGDCSEFEELPTAPAPRVDQTGIPEVDVAIAVLLSNDPQARRPLVHLTTAGCTTVMGLGGPPKCGEGQPEGTPIDYLPLLGPGEGATVLPEDLDRSLDFEVEALYAAYRRVDKPITDPYYPAGEYGLFFTTNQEGPNANIILVHLDAEGFIVRIDYLAQIVNMGRSPETIMELEAGDVLVRPPE